jgi:hypothetical protein
MLIDDGFVLEAIEIIAKENGIRGEITAMLADSTLVG